ncbi:FGFR1 oncogene partner isoform X2 [Brienomyrus brachyistius]|uniref:FGFR1 oncogene partner isoform X2 n=1 Tax=Brienomyrus brachyistius TaxID=42636 RepID=UPI0020B3C1D9|nr:FGFR1 oncogene partner isoform X2 [Brienomyrus brachyistius]
MSAAEEDTELRDLLIQNLENNGVLNKIKAELRAAVFLALEQQDKEENKPPLVNESLKKFLNTKDGRLATSLVIDFLQVFNLDFTLAVFQPEINTLNGLENREAATQELAIGDLDDQKEAPLLLELIKRNRQKDKPCVSTEELSPRQVTDARRKFDTYDKERRGEITTENLRILFSDVCPGFHKSVLDQHVNEELALDRSLGSTVSFQDFLGLYKRFFHQCRSVFSGDGSDTTLAPAKLHEEKLGTSLSSKIPRYKGLIKHNEEMETAAPKASEANHSSTTLTTDSLKNRSHVQLSSREPGREDNPPTETRNLDPGLDDDEDEGDSFFDDPLPKPQKTYGCTRVSFADKSNAGSSFSTKKNGHKDVNPSEKDKSVCGDSFSQMRRMSSLTDLSAINSDSEDDPVGDTFSDRASGALRSAETDARINVSKPAGAQLGAVNDGPPPRSSVSVQLVQNDLQEHRSDEEDYDDDFNSTSHRSDNSKSEVSIGEDIDEASVEGPEGSDKVSELEELTQDHSVSQLSQAADYMEEVA